MRRTILSLVILTFINVLSKSLSAQTHVCPDFVYRPWVWEDESTQQSATQLVADYEAHNIPVGAIIIDSPWETGYNSFDWDTTLFQNPKAMVDTFHAHNVKVLVWITTAIDTDMHQLWHYADSMGFFMKASAGGSSAIIHWWKGNGSMIDFFNPQAVTWWKTQMDKLLNIGIDGWKCDGTDYSILLGGATYSPGAGGTVTRLQYSHAYYQLFYDYTRQQLGTDRAIMSRPVDNYGYTFITDPSLVSFTPREIGFACWVGDQDATFAGMTNALNNMYQSYVNNYLVFGSDIGGYRDQPVTNGRDKDLFIRWAQLGAFSPLMENGGGGEHRPWIFDQQTNDIYKLFADLHQALVPYQLQQGDSLFNITQSLMQFLNSTDYQFALGSDIFVAPVLSSAGTVQINGFPGSGDSWVYLFDNSQAFQSGTSTSMQVPLNQFPVFIKSTSPLLATLTNIVNTATGIEAVDAQTATISVFPNPTNNQIAIAGLNFKNDIQYEFTLTDALGRNLLNQKLTGNSSTIQLSNFESGVYHYNIRGLNNTAALTTSGTVVVQK